jgi:hypothetical protein
MLFSGCGFVILVALLFADQSFENEKANQEISWEKTKENLSACYKAAQRPIFYKALLFFFLQGLTNPSFGEYTYYYTLDFKEVSLF